MVAKNTNKRLLKVFWRVKNTANKSDCGEFEIWTQNGVRYWFYPGLEKYTLNTRKNKHLLPGTAV